MDFLKTKQPKEKKERKVDPSSQDFGGVNLIVEERSKEVSQDLLKKNIIQILGSAVIAFCIVGIVYGGIRYYGSAREKEIQTIRDVIQRTEAEISNLERNASALSQFQNKLTSLKSLLDNHVSLVKFFLKLEEITLANVAYSNVSLSHEGSVSLSAISTDYTSVGKQLLAYQKVPEMITKVKMTSVNGMLSQTGDVSGVSFNLALTISKDWLSKKETQTMSQTPLQAPTQTPSILPVSPVPSPTGIPTFSPTPGPLIPLVPPVSPVPIPTFLPANQ